MANHPIVKPATTHTNEMRTPAGRPGERERERSERDHRSERDRGQRRDHSTERGRQTEGQAEKI